ncbi:hypothetical protein [Actinacidiphila paucisporea]|uniref:Uncharacterized protein n=1 Tax=Actinacidiphila paucisporea TaxID=310782 RepID=A0A1M6VBR4_9ACTN|nr:hypothetical protein [Actinacidiphila paucisporea]SHK78795.1 hypothetical protein SAMN05216499_101636 [Actinacidiphila paucisporea]
MHRLQDLSAADWLSATDARPMRLITFGPAGFPAYARLRFIPDPAGPGLSEADAELPDDHPSDIEQARTVLLALGESAEPCFFCVWEGYGGSFFGPESLRGPLVELPHRRYALYAGALGDIAAWERDFGAGHPCPPPAFAWPADHRWCFTSDVDPHWAGIGATDRVIDALTARTDVDVVRARPEQAPPAYDG